MAIHTVRRCETFGQNGVAAPPKIILRRTGKKPLRFSGVCLAEASGYTRTQPMWYEIGLYRRETRGFVVSVRVFTKSQSEKDRTTAVRFDALGEALTFLENYEVTNDLRSFMKVPQTKVPAVQHILRAARLRGKIAQYQNAYDTVCAHVLYDMDARTVAA